MATLASRGSMPVGGRLDLGSALGYEPQIGTRTSPTTISGARRVASAAAAPLVIGSINLDEVSTAVGNSLGLTSPEPEWVSARAELAERLHIELAGNEVPPCWRWFPTEAGPPTWCRRMRARSTGPCRCACRGACRPLRRRLLTPCVAYYCPLANGADFDNPYVVEVRLGDVAALVDPGAGRHGTPSNFWPVIDRGWSSLTGTSGHEGRLHRPDQGFSVCTRPGVHRLGADDVIGGEFIDPTCRSELRSTDAPGAGQLSRDQLHHRVDEEEGPERALSPP